MVCDCLGSLSSNFATERVVTWANLGDSTVKLGRYRKLLLKLQVLLEGNIDF